MTSHDLAAFLLELPNLPVVINGWGSDEGLGPFEVDTYFMTEGKKIALNYMKVEPPPFNWEEGK